MILTHLILGSNSNDKQTCLSRAIALLKEQTGEIVKLSHIYVSEAWGYESANTYLNQALTLRTNLSPALLLSNTQEIEKQLGRNNKTVNGIYLDRPIDIDILFYDKRIIQKPDLSIPHPRMAERRFVLTPLSEIDPNFVHPVAKKSIHQLLSECQDPIEVTRLE